MNRKSLLGLILFAILITAGLFLSADFLASQNKASNGNGQEYVKEDAAEDNITSVDAPEITSDEASQNVEEDSSITGRDKASSVIDDASSDQITGFVSETTDNTVTEEPWLYSNPSDAGAAVTDNPEIPTVTASPDSEQNSEGEQDISTVSINTVPAPQLIFDCTKVDYMSYIPKMITDGELEAALNISNPNIELDAEAAILFDADTKEVLYYKNPVQAMFPASTAKLLTSLVVLQRCEEDEQVTIGDEIKLIAPDATTANLKEGQVLTIHNLLEGMLLPSGNDAAYAVATFVGRKSLNSPNASKEEAIAEFERLMNEEAATLGVKNSCFKSPDGYDAIGQYTTAYDMGMIGIAAAKNSIITEISKKSSSRNIFASGEDITWTSTNKLITRYSGQYYSHAIGLKTGTTTMAGRCVIAAAEKDGKIVVCVIMDSTSAGRWEDAIALLKYGLK